LEVTKQLGYNLVRKHVKVEPARWYYHCDKLGLVVWQDMPNGDAHIGPNDPDIERSEESAENYRREYKAMIDSLYNHPSITAWVPFNEGWGQYNTNEILAWTKQYDSTRLVDAPSGWADRGTGDMNDMHMYPGPGMPDPEADRAVVLGEFGGLGLPLEGHLWWNRRNWGYRTYRTQEELQSNYAMLIRRLRPLVARGLAAAVYTQTTDVEGEVNGLMTYDREVIKFDPDELVALHNKLKLPQPRFVTQTLVPTSEEEPQTWRYTTSQPRDGWTRIDFSADSWNEGPGGFGQADTPGAVVRTPWQSSDIWLRRDFELDTVQLHDLQLVVHHDEDAEIFINGQRVAALSGYTTDYVEVPLSDEARTALRLGRNTLAIHCRQTDGGQYIDVGLIDVVEKPREESSQNGP
jgi:hypothetical protein